jgi:hypothetical protein
MSAESLEFWKNLFEIAGVVLLLLTFIAGASVLWFSRKLNDRQAAQLRQFDKDLTDAKTKLGEQQERAAAAEKALKGVDAKTEGFRLAIAKANERATKAQESLALAEQHAAEANAKAEGFRLDIAKANKSAAEAQAQVAAATAEAAKANLELARLKTPRSLTRVPELVASLAPFTGTEYVFTSVFQDEDSIFLLRSIDDVLQKAGWKRGKSVGGFPGINPYGKDVPDFSVPIGFGTGVQVSTEAPRPFDFDKVQIKDLPPYIQAAGTLKFALAQCISPLQENSTGKVAEVGQGTSTIIRIAVGKKP